MAMTKPGPHRITRPDVSRWKQLPKAVSGQSAEALQSQLQRIGDLVRSNSPSLPQSTGRGALISSTNYASSDCTPKRMIEGSHVPALLSRSGVARRWPEAPAEPRKALEAALVSATPLQRQWLREGRLQRWQMRDGSKARPFQDGAMRITQPTPEGWRPLIQQIFDLCSFTMRERADDSEILDALARLAGVFPRYGRSDVDAAIPWLHAVQGLPKAYLVEAFGLWVATKREFPVPADIVALTNELAEPHRRMGGHCRSQLTAWIEADEQEELPL